MRRDSDGGKTAILPEQGGVSGADHGVSRRTSGGSRATAGGDPAHARTVEWTEWLVPGMGTALRDIEPCASVVSAHQHIEIGSHPVLGHVFRLDGRIMSAEADAFIQHEIMVHPMALAHGSPARALVIGGGDGGSARELLRLSGMREIVVAELDPEVVALARRWLPGIHHGALDAPMVQWRFGDAMDTMAALRNEGRRFDLIVFDLTEADDGGPATPLFAQAGLALARACLAPGGALSMHLGPAFHRPASARMLAQRLRAHFRIVRPMTIPIAAYGALWAIAIASDSCDPCSPDHGEIARRLREWKLEDRLRCYHAGLHHALFALPRHLQDVLLPAAPAERANPERAHPGGPPRP